MKQKVFITIFALYFAVQPLPAYDVEDWPEISHADNSEAWHRLNDHLIPDAAENEAIALLNQDYDGLSNGEDADIDDDGILNEEDEDIDGDGVLNELDPSPFDWREAGFNPFGMLAFLNWNHSWNSHMYDGNRLEKAVETLKEMGVGIVRMDFGWEDIESEEDEYDFEKYDEIVGILSENNIRMLGIFSYCASWAGKRWNGPPENNEDFVEYMSVTIDRYKSFVKYWEIWNEPDSRTYWATQDRMKRYSELLKDCYTAAKDIDPSCRILMGGLTENSIVPLRNIYRNGCRDYFDIVNIHPFVNPLKKERFKLLRGKINSVKRVMKKYGDEDKKIWLTELGSPGIENPTKENGWWHGISPDEQEQADWVGDIYKKAVNISGVEKIFWAFFQDSRDHFHSGVDYFGLVRDDFSYKPGFHIYKECRDLLELP